MREEVTPIRVEVPTSDTASSPVALADTTPEQAAVQRYREAIGHLLNDALEHNRVGVLADTLAWTIARIVVGFGVPATGDIFRRIGGYVGELWERRSAQEEAKQARKEGRAMN